MKQLICPIGKKPCDRDCHDRYPDQPEGGCRLTTAQEMGAKIVILGNGTVGMLFTPGEEDDQ